MKLINTIYILECLACAMEYGGYSGLTYEEMEQLDTYLIDYPHCYFDYGYDSEFRRCDITGSMGNCIKVDIYKEA